MALAVFDTPAQGGNDDDRISREDAVWNSLLIWDDRNHNGISDAGELSWVEAAGIDSIALDYKESNRRDRFGNVLRYRSKVSGPSDQLGRWAVDVFLTHRP